MKNPSSKTAGAKLHDKVKKNPTPPQAPVPRPSSSSSSLPAAATGGRGQGAVNGGISVKSREAGRPPQARAKDKAGRRNGSGALKRPRENGHTGGGAGEAAKRGRPTAEGVNGAVHVYSESDVDEDGGARGVHGSNGQVGSEHLVGGLVFSVEASWIYPPQGSRVLGDLVISYSSSLKEPR